MIQVSEGFEFSLKGCHREQSTTVAVQHAGDPNQSTNVMFFRREEILLSLNGDGVAEMIIGILRRWKGKRPDKFQDIKSLL